jgi:DNA-binding FadR family transcriptional regulator
LEARRAIEPACARVAANRAKPDDIAALKNSIARMSADLDDDAVFWTENANFHVALAEAGSNTVLNTLMVSLRELIYEFTAGLHIEPEERSETVAEHTDILAGIIDSDPDAAARAAEAHLASFELRLKQVYPNLDSVCLTGATATGNGKLGGE